MSLKRIIQRGGGYARRRDRPRDGQNKPFTPKEQDEMRKFAEELPKQTFGCFMLFMIAMFVLLGIELLRQKLFE